MLELTAELTQVLNTQPQTIQAQPSASVVTTTSPPELDYGTPVSGTVEDCLQQAGLDYTVDLGPVLFRSNITGTQNYVPNHFVTYRTDTGKPFGVVKSRYHIIQNSTVYSFLDYVTGLALTNAGHLRSGGWLCGKFDNEVVLNDVYAPYFFFSNSHDGSSKFTIAFSPIRIACKSVVNLLPQQSFQFTIKHTQIATHKIKVAQNFLKQSLAAMDSLRQIAADTSARHFTPIDVSRLFEEILISRTGGKKGRTFTLDMAALWDCYNSQDLTAYQGTGYGILLAVARFITHVLSDRARNKDAIFRNTLFKTHPLLKVAYEVVMR